ncbi:hypothetical protein HO173_008949 [Letharia columbiana]|uniref:F-box domain-containing protein n=1 Tax=Letharia columbiana TaxID=112416 RepID=A0A8H6FQB9_9LECA|nr:uncharacterized protein HO173_008949 [Letharia columbiana]KAF6232735.1 hypothetical protein HO173_008949 [Letharia columbiana]
MDECYCALCGVSFGILPDLYHDRVSDDDVAWTDFFLLLRQHPQSENAGNAAVSSYFRSGIGWTISLNNARAPPLGHDARGLDDVQLRTQVNDDHDRVAPYTSRDTECEVAFPFHAACWDLFVQEFALLAKGDNVNPDLDALGRLLSSQTLEDEGRGLHPDWVEDYGGPEMFWSDGWADHPEPEASNVAGILDSYTQLDYLVMDPFKLCEQVQEICDEPPVLVSIQGQASVGINGPGNCYFSRFPMEILTYIISFLPTPSVHTFRAASRAIAWINLDSTFWHSRFLFPNEFSHVFKPSIQSVTKSNQSPIDWKRLYKRVSSIVADDEYTKNRQRICRLNQQLLLRMRSCAGIPKAVESKRGSLTPVFFCRQKIKIPGIQITSEQSILFHQLTPPEHDPPHFSSFLFTEGPPGTARDSIS